MTARNPAPQRSQVRSTAGTGGVRQHAWEQYRPFPRAACEPMIQNVAPHVTHVRATDGRFGARRRGFPSTVSPSTIR